MKNFRTLFAVCLLAMATAVNAQFANSSASSAGGAADTEGWQSVKFSYNSYTPDAKGADWDAIPAFELGYVKAISISETMPLFLEAGASLIYATGDLYDEEYGIEYEGYDFTVSETNNLKMFTLAVPVNIGYKLALSDNITLFPYAGISLKGHLSGKLESESKISGYGESESESKSYNVFDDDDMGDAWKRFQIGWQIGATVNVNKFNVGLSYGTDITEIADDVDTKTLKISAGFNF